MLQTAATTPGPPRPLPPRHQLPQCSVVWVRCKEKMGPHRRTLSARRRHDKAEPGKFRADDGAPDELAELHAVDGAVLRAELRAERGADAVRSCVQLASGRADSRGREHADAGGAAGASENFNIKTLNFNIIVEL